MESSSSETTVTAVTPPSSCSVSPSSSSPRPPPPPSTAVASPCAACKILRRRCADKCVLAPYFPPNDPIKFTTAHRVFGASNIIKFLQELPEAQRADAVSSMVYEANARLRDPVYGSAGAICQLQNQVSQLQAELAQARAELINMQFQLQSNIMLATHHHHLHQQSSLDYYECFNNDNNNLLSSLDETNNFGCSFLEQTLWT